AFGFHPLLSPCVTNVEKWLSHPIDVSHSPLRYRSDFADPVQKTRRAASCKWTSPQGVMTPSRYTVPFTFVFAVIGHATTSHAESNEFNLHAGAGLYLHDTSGPGGFLGLDWQFRPGFAFDASFLAATESSALSNDTAITAMLGLRFRFIDDYRGYLNEPHGN